MIIVDVYVPALDRVYHFNLDEDSRVSALIEEISDLICRKEHAVLDGDKAGFLLGSVDEGVNFRPGHSLREYGVKNGDRLILA